MKLNKSVARHLRKTWVFYVGSIAAIALIVVLGFAGKASDERAEVKRATEISRVRDITICEAKGYIPMQRVGSDEINCVETSYPVKEFYADLSGAETD